MPRGLAIDPISECELALELGMSLTELRQGRGTPMPLSEMTVEWPLFWGYRSRVEGRQQAEQAKANSRVGG